MAEDTFVGYLCTGFRKAGYHVVKHNDINVGVPDISVYDPVSKQTRWIEVKSKQLYPAKPTTRIWWPHYTEEQALFLRKRDGLLAVRVEKDYYLFNASIAWHIFENKGILHEDMAQSSDIWWKNKIDWDAMDEVLFA